MGTMKQNTVDKMKVQLIFCVIFSVIVLGKGTKMRDLFSVELCLINVSSETRRKRGWGIIQ